MCKTWLVISTMESSLCYLISKCLIILLCLCIHLFTRFLSSTQPLCHDSESSALLQFKQSLKIKESASKIASWKLGGDNNDCCLWKGIDCDENSGHVIDLDLSNSNLYGSINSNSSLFQLDHLQSLNLAFNDFSYSEIPARIGQLSRLTYLNLSSSVFSGKISPLICSMSSLQVPNLSNNSLDGSIPQRLFNFSYSLQVVNLKSNNLQGGIPQSWSEVNNLKLINLSQNKIQGQLPKSLAYCTALENLDVSDNQLNDVFPTYLAAQG
ncbi:putative Leucine-rich receptor-like kinase family protein [Quillaja saponaria]|uniref:Leucine-rich receptor-like kinase family protein n=1 Tax=Quillaja saponaria TaxID=32244 RepID=A0AAD7PUA5_QUISA|nr:putative Leucine-rich receptor-like kinase family protein [Quillaja saponaria]